MKIEARAVGERLEGLGDSRKRQGNSGFTDLYFDPKGEDDGRPLFILHHIRKTAGTSLREVVRSNYDEAGLVRIAGLGRERGVEVSRARLLEFSRELWGRLRSKERAALRCVASHEANFLEPFVDRPKIVVTLIRAPVERTLSQYYFAQRSAANLERRERAGKVSTGLSKVLRQIPLEAIYDPTRASWPSEIRDRLDERGRKRLEDRRMWMSLFNGQARSILEPHFDVTELAPTAGPGADADVWRERLFAVVDQHYLAGTSERFEEFVADLSARFGWSAVTVPQMKVNEARPSSSSIAPDLESAIRDHNWLDMELYERVSRLGRS
jgi:hypothetical protein